MKKIFKKLLIICGIITAISVTTNIAVPQSVSAYGNDCHYFLGMTSWDCHVVENVTSEDQLKTNIWTIAANVATNITVIAAYLIIGYVIYGGYLYIFSGGDPNKVATGKKALTQAFIGLAIVLSANVILNSIIIALGGKDFTTEQCIGFGGNNKNNNLFSSDCYKDGASDMITRMLNWVIGIAGVVSVIFLVYGSISYITSTGDPNKVKKAKDIILYALIGLAIVGLSEIIVIFVSNVITDANNSPNTTNTNTNTTTNTTNNSSNPTSLYIKPTIISKETHEA